MTAKKNKSRGDPKRNAAVKKAWLDKRNGVNRPKKGSLPLNPHAQHRAPGEKKMKRVEFLKLTHDVPAIAEESKKVQENEVFAK